MNCFKDWESNYTFQYILETLAMNHLLETCIFQRNWTEAKNKLQDGKICSVVPENTLRLLNSNIRCSRTIPVFGISFINWINISFLWDLHKEQHIEWSAYASSDPQMAWLYVCLYFIWIVALTFSALKSGKDQ